MTQTQRKKALAEAQERLRLADEALKAAQDARTEAWCAVRAVQEDIERNEPLTKAQAECVRLMYEGGLKICSSAYARRGKWLNTPGKYTPVRDSVYEGLVTRGILGEFDRVNGRNEFPLSDWGREVAEALAGKGGS